VIFRYRLRRVHVFRLPQTLVIKHTSISVLATTQATVSIADNNGKWISLYQYYTFCQPSMPGSL